VQPTNLVIDVLATRRITRLLVEDEITRPLREKIGRYHAKAGYLVTCPYCVSVWAGGVVAFLLPRKVRIALALSEGAILVGTASGLIEE